MRAENGGCTAKSDLFGRLVMGLFDVGTDRRRIAFLAEVRQQQEKSGQPSK
jgi:hypothetical protein